MHVVATAGHVDHGKSTLVRALTGTDPDRLEEEHRRGLSIELGYCWTTLADIGEVAFVDVPGHERFVPTMLTGVGPVPAVLLVVAADDEWMPQAAEHLAALDAFGVCHGIVAVTRSDLADPAPMADRARAEIATTGLAGAEVLAVSGRTGAGLPALRRALATMLRRLPAVDARADVRLWVDRCFVVRGAGTVVTGTLQAGTVAVGDILRHGADRVRVRGVQTLGREVEQAVGVARVALRLGGGVPGDLARGSVLVTPQAWRDTEQVDVRVTAGHAAPERPVLHIGATALGCHYRPLGDRLARLTLERPLPLRVGDRALLRDPGSGRIWGAEVLDPAVPSIRRRGAAADRARRLALTGPLPDLADELDRRRWAQISMLRRIGVPTDQADRIAVQANGWLLDARRVPALSRRLADLLASHRREEPLSRGLPVSAVAQTLGLPTSGLVPALLPEGSAIRDGRVVQRTADDLPPALEEALRRLHDDLAEHPFRAPDAGRMAELGLNRRAVAAAAGAGRLLRLTDTLVLLPGADERAAALLAELPQPFSASDARRHLDTTRRVVLPLLDWLDRRGLTTRLPDDRRRATNGA
ncbi:MAG TPA: selenocysteine-specific translation elongation factor [Nocardioidaceae bacterium]|nr:selenocysteine-specific translation elongation factor [Nocardioidaceae bacterium]